MEKAAIKMELSPAVFGAATPTGFKPVIYDKRSRGLLAKQRCKLFGDLIRAKRFQGRHPNRPVTAIRKKMRQAASIISSAFCDTARA